MNRSDVAEAVHRFFEHVDAYDYRAMSATLTCDFELIQDAVRMDLEEFQRRLRQLEARGARLAHDPTDFSTEMTGEFAYTSYRVRDPKANIEWLESAVLRRSGDQWLIGRVHSTRVRTGL